VRTFEVDLALVVPEVVLELRHAEGGVLVVAQVLMARRSKARIGSFVWISLVYCEMTLTKRFAASCAFSHDVMTRRTMVEPSVTERIMTFSTDTPASSAMMFTNSVVSNSLSGTSRRSVMGRELPWLALLAVGQQLDLGERRALRREVLRVAADKALAQRAVLGHRRVDHAPRLTAEVPQTADRAADEEQAGDEHADEDPVGCERDVGIAVDATVDEGALRDGLEGHVGAALVDAYHAEDGDRVDVGRVVEHVDAGLREGEHEGRDGEVRGAQRVGEVTELGVVEVGVRVQEVVLVIDRVVLAARVGHVPHDGLAVVDADDGVDDRAQVLRGVARALQQAARHRGKRRGGRARGLQELRHAGVVHALRAVVVKDDHLNAARAGAVAALRLAANA
jgi:hypothetical protein